jgi:hypothetical protein
VLTNFENRFKVVGNKPRVHRSSTLINLSRPNLLNTDLVARVG